MAQSQLALYNLAVAILGEPFTIEAVDEETIPAEDCTLWYENVRQTVLRAAHWKSCKRFVKLSTEVADRSDGGDWEAGDPHPGFKYSYELPSGWLAARHLSSYDRFDVGYDDTNSKHVLYCDEVDPILVYTKDVTDVTLWESDLYKAVAYGLAAHITPQRTGKRAKSADNIAMANEIITNARVATANEEYGRMDQPIPESLAVRGYAPYVAYGYIAPYGALLTGTGVATK